MSKNSNNINNNTNKNSGYDDDMMWWTIKKGRLDLIARFAKQEIDVNITDKYKRTPLLVAISSSNRLEKGKAVEIVKLLLTHPNIDIYIVDENGENAKNYAFWISLDESELISDLLDSYNKCLKALRMDNHNAGWNIHHKDKPYTLEQATSAAAVNEWQGIWGVIANSDVNKIAPEGINIAMAVIKVFNDTPSLNSAIILKGIMPKIDHDICDKNGKKAQEYLDKTTRLFFDIMLLWDGYCKKVRTKKEMKGKDVRLSLDLLGETIQASTGLSSSFTTLFFTPSAHPANSNVSALNKENKLLDLMCSR